MGKFSSSKIFYNCDRYIDNVAKQFSEQMQQEGFDINAQKVSDGKWDISINAYSGDTRSPIPVISVHFVSILQYRWQS